MSAVCKEDLIKEGYPYIKYSRYGAEQTEAFLTDQACDWRIGELQREGVTVTKVPTSKNRIQTVLAEGGCLLEYLKGAETITEVFILDRGCCDMRLRELNNLGYQVRKEKNEVQTM